MAGNKLIKQLKEEIEKYLNIPYSKNKLKNGKIILEVPYGAKGTWQQIQKITNQIAKEKKLDLKNLNNKQLYNFQKKHKIGIDCSGFCYHLLNKIYQLNFKKNIKAKLIGTNNKKGVRRLSANLLTNSINATKISNYNNIQTGDLIRFDKGVHVIFIIEKKGDTIYYVHSSNKTKTRGVHHGTIKITNPQKTLNYQQWSECIFPNSGDTIFRLNCFIRN
ncbi:C40 family peptidase [Patescibacteria group bacterium]|nr:C40 family peptidase [Patescibacteria group bacterium]